MKISIFSIVLLLLCTFSVWGNDGIYYVSGNQLIPLQENDIAVQKEILIINLKDDGFANVDVYYEFFNNGQKKNILMGFEADAPYNSGEKFNHNGIHPDIFDFSVNMNGNALNYSNAVVKRAFNGNNNFTRLDLSKWKHPSEDKKTQEIVPTDEMLYNADLDSIVDFAYSYYFQATFNPGLNIVKHHYKYRLSYDVACTFSLPYKLTPATRWANHKIDNFTLILRADSTAKHFLIEESAFAEKPFKLKEGTGKIREHISVYSNKYTEVSLRNGAIIWQKDDFSPQKELHIISADAKIADNMESKGFKKAQFYDRSDNYPAPLFNVDEKLTAFQKRIVRNLPFAHRGYVFHNPQLKKYFEGLWWYMPDNSYNGSTDDFTKHEMELIKNK